MCSLQAANLGDLKRVLEAPDSRQWVSEFFLLGRWNIMVGFLVRS